MRRPAVRARVVVLAPDGTTLQVAALTAAETTIGTSGDVSLSDPYVSPVHARLVFRGNALFVVPESTLNGVFALVKSDVELHPGSELRLGRQLLRLEAFPSPPASAEPVWGSSHPPYRYRFVQLLQGGVEGDVYPLRDGDSLMGRVAGDVSFPGDGYVSSRHAVVSIRDGRAFVRDIGSSNGTFVRLASEARVEPGDLLLFGEQLLRLDAP